ncbi:diguanylate cyclase (GGDEF) domain-containing protein [Cupriavidus sp. YR651]|uniref:GGDEF domain-containing protein n=1 Tax=Cupriavidus sp. YR651 TaxID=1855315 RepID=UPI00088D8E38|nr:GGDEF domain-containing protein [Cupriavidus sp. YR651]SDD71260.1 diguanylate cyclase (GGDEF) domain-containing protein [Cupriavidus sp. YR651]
MPGWPTLRRRAARHGLPGQFGPSLRRKLGAGAAVAAFCATGLAGMLMARSYSDFATARQNLYDIAGYRELLDAANVLSAERGPANSVMGEGLSPDSPARERLNRFRARSDAALARLTDPPPAPFWLHAHPVPPLMIDRVRERLTRARAEIDRLSALPLPQRQLEDIQHAIEGMFEVVDTLQPAISWQVKKLSSCNAGLAAPAITGRMLGDLREYGGRIASNIIAPIAARQSLPLGTLVDFNRTRGRLLELWQLTGAAYSLYGDAPALREAYADADRRFFGQGLQMVDSLVAQGRVGGHYSMTPTELTNRYVPTLEPLERLRKTFLDDVIRHFDASRDSALRVLLAAGGAAALILAVLAQLMLFAQRSLFRPLLAARDEVIALAEERAPPAFAAMPENARQAGELRRLFDALDILRRKLRERATMTEELEHQARTDGLTGLLNRRALELMAGHLRDAPTTMLNASYAGFGQIDDADDLFADEANAQRVRESVCLILMDLDHFKRINDRFGHPAGDAVLRDIADLIRSHVSAPDVPARFGGEEFAILMPATHGARALALAETLRLTIAAHTIRLSGGARLEVTASFGVAMGPRGQRHWDALFAAADAALYQAKSDGRNCVRHAPGMSGEGTSGKMPAAAAT